MKTIFRIICISAAAVLAFSCAEKPRSASVIIPQPAAVTNTGGTFRLTAKTPVYSNLPFGRTVSVWPEGMPGRIYDTPETKPEAGFVNLVLEETLWQERDAYRLEITPEQITIFAAREEGLFYGIQSLRQLYDIYGRDIPCAAIEDSPRFRSRGLLLDASRHFFPVDFIKKQLDMMACLKMNCFVWYLAGDGGWRLETDSYPQLTQECAWRTAADYAEWKENGGGFCAPDTPGAYGGYYTEEEIADILEYAAGRFITVIPAIDLPCAHTGVASALGIECSTGTTGRDEEAEAVKDILSSVVDIFSPQYIYLGNGQADQSRGAFCLECQPRIERGKTGNILDSRHGYILQQAENFLNKKGVGLMAWDESIRGVLSHEAAVISWNKAEEGLTAAEMGYGVILSPSAYSSLDYYQADPAASPVPSPGYLPLGELYNYDPVPYDFPQESASNILGIQANLWTSHIPGEKEAEYMLYPRLLGVAEAAWTKPEMKSHLNFRNRAERMSGVLRKKGYRCFDIGAAAANRPEYTQPVRHLAWGKSVTYITQANRQFPGSGVTTLTDGQRGGWSFDDGRWQGFRSTDLDVVIDLGSATEISSVSADFLQDYISGIWMPAQVEIYTSDDGENFSLLATVENKIPADRKKFTIAPFAWKGKAETRYIRYKAYGSQRVGGWLFSDEIVIH